MIDIRCGDAREVLAGMARRRCRQAVTEPLFA